MNEAQPAFDFAPETLPTRAEEIRIYLDENRGIYRAFESEALEMIRVGLRRYSARTIIEVLRHHSALQADPDQKFKVNNDLAPTLARDFMARHPEAPKDFFAQREARVATTPKGDHS